MTPVGCLGGACRCSRQLDMLQARPLPERSERSQLLDPLQRPRRQPPSARAWICQAASLHR